MAHWITFKEEQLLDWQKDYLSRLCKADQEIAQTYDLIQLFTTMLRERHGEQLDTWLKQVEEQGVAELQSFAEATSEGLRCGEIRAQALLVGSGQLRVMSIA